MGIIQLAHSHLALTVPLLERKYFSTTFLVLFPSMQRVKLGKRYYGFIYIFKNKSNCVWIYLQLAHKHKCSSIPLILLLVGLERWAGANIFLS